MCLIEDRFCRKGICCAENNQSHMSYRCAKKFSGSNFNQAVIGKILFFFFFKKLPQISHFHTKCMHVFFKYNWNFQTNCFYLVNSMAVAQRNTLFFNFASCELLSGVCFCRCSSCVHCAVLELTGLLLSYLISVILIYHCFSSLYQNLRVIIVVTQSSTKIIKLFINTHEHAMLYIRAFQLKSTAGRTPISRVIRRAAWSKIKLCIIGLQVF